MLSSQFVFLPGHHTPSLKRSWRNWTKRWNSKTASSLCFALFFNRQFYNKVNEIRDDVCPVPFCRQTLERTQRPACLCWRRTRSCCSTDSPSTKEKLTRRPRRDATWKMRVNYNVGVWSASTGGCSKDEGSSLWIWTMSRLKLHI